MLWIHDQRINAISKWKGDFFLFYEVFKCIAEFYCMHYQIVLSLEGGYDLPSICDSAEECVRVLLGDEASCISEEELARVPCQNAIYTLQKIIAIQVSYQSRYKLSLFALCVFFKYKSI